MPSHTPATFVGELLGRLRTVPSWLWRAEARFKGAQFLGKSEFIGRPMIGIASGATVIFGDGVQIYSSTRANPLGLFQPCVLRALQPGARLILGAEVGLSGAVICAGESIEIGDQTILGAGAMVLDNDFHQPSGEWAWSDDTKTGARPIKIGRGVFIGARAIILKGVTIGDRATIGAGAIVTRDVPERHIAAGNPARSFLPTKG
jgi:acetyltransferase-like isoleucine patch superfamily enzyme